MADEETEASSANRLDFEKLFQMAQDPDLEDILRGELETALLHLDGIKETQKLSAIRKLPELMESDGEECIAKMLPAIQRVLKEEKSNLDIHCEAAVIYKTVLQNEKLCQRFPGIIDTLLDHILKNIQGQKENLSAAAWLETLVETADRVSLDALKQYIVPVVQQQAEPVQRVQRRIIATKLLHKLADILPPNEVRKELGPCAQMLCQDANANVRTSMSQRLPVIARALKNASDCVSLLLPCFVQLCKDDDINVREACMNNIAQCIPHFTNEAKKSSLFPLIKKSTEDSLEKKDDILAVIAKHLGQWAYELREVLDQLDMSWILNSYCKIVTSSLGTAGRTAPTQSLFTMCRRMSAFNLPCMIQLFPKSFDRLLPFMESFCTDSDDEVRSAMAASFHEVLLLHGLRADLLPPFVELIRGGASEVVAKMTYNLDTTLPILYKCSATAGSSKVTTSQLDRMLIGCNQVLRGSGCWRSHEALLKNLSVLTSCVSFRQLHEVFVPVLQKEVLTARAIPCRIAAARTLLVFMRENADSAQRESVLQFLRKEIAAHSSCYRRGVFLDVAQLAIRIFSRRFFFRNFLADTLAMTRDNVANVRLKAVRLLPLLKSHFHLPDDNTQLLEMEKTVREALSSEKEQTTRQILQVAACELSRCEAKGKCDKEDAEKEAEEDRLWNEERIKELEEKEKQEKEKEKEKENERKPSGLKPPESPRGASPNSFKQTPEAPRMSSPWRLQRRAVAVVRPQPVVVMRSASPVPKAGDNNSRPSRLPLSTASREKESLRRAVETSGLPRPTSRSMTSSNNNRNVMSTSTSSLESSSNGYSSPNSYGLRRSATTTTGFGSVSTSSSSYSLTPSRSSSSIRRPVYGLTKVSSSSTLERKPPHLSLRIHSNS